MIKTSQKIILTICLLVMIGKVNSQEQIDCQFNINKAINYLEGNDFYKKDKGKALEYLKPCLAINDPLAQIIMARVLLEKDSEKTDKEAFNLLKKAADSGNHIAMSDLGNLYKYGIGCNLNFNKARKWYLKAYKLGNNKAAYSLGYLYLKGFGNINQDYKKAVKWFKKSKYPMARYWLGICYYHGYGVNKNIAKANAFLNTNFKEITNIDISDKLSEKQKKVVEQITEEEKTQFTYSKTIEDQKLIGNWKGTILLMDWSDSVIEHKVPVEISFSKQEDTGLLQTSWKVNNKTYSKDFTQINNTFFYDDLSIKMPHTSFKEEIPKELKHEIIEVDFSIKHFGNKNYLTAEVVNYVNQWKENGAPIRMLLTKKQILNNSEKELSDQAILALTEQKQEFIKLYPNPFEKDLLISYSIKEPQNTTVFINDINGFNKQIIKPEGIQNTDTYTYFVEGNTLANGMYIVTVVTKDKKYTRIIVKK
ncbi:T9SS type A sorting domain-containing protein [Tenacibaculum sp. nBUS_03]|uniref:tetratricopeptide repeat protein n=1 Tax=Tenacibaculum sp. nBUS_03 TaxID=3395320 RepID=UPI003EB82CAC